MDRSTRSSSFICTTESPMLELQSCLMPPLSHSGLFFPCNVPLPQVLSTTIQPLTEFLKNVYIALDMKHENDAIGKGGIGITTRDA